MGQILVVRHGQASFGADDYDVLSATGEEQARVLGRALATTSPDLVVHGSLVRQRYTAELAAEAAGWSAPLREDARWNELESLSQFAAASGQVPDLEDRDAFQQWYEAAMDRWTDGQHDADYAETYRAFRQRAHGALLDLADAGTVVAVSSGGPIAAIATVLLDGGPATYRRLLPGIVNTGITRVVSGRRGLTLVSFNEHQHLSTELLSYR